MTRRYYHHGRLGALRKWPCRERERPKVIRYAASPDRAWRLLGGLYGDHLEGGRIRGALQLHSEAGHREEVASTVGCFGEVDGRRACLRSERTLFNAEQAVSETMPGGAHRGSAVPAACLQSERTLFNAEQTGRAASETNDAGQTHTQGHAALPA